MTDQTELHEGSQTNGCSPPGDPPATDITGALEAVSSPEASPAATTDSGGVVVPILRPGEYRVVSTHIRGGLVMVRACGPDGDLTYKVPERRPPSNIADLLAEMRRRQVGEDVPSIGDVVRITRRRYVAPLVLLEYGEAAAPGVDQ